jgi:hypothetical protein
MGVQVEWPGRFFDAGNEPDGRLGRKREFRFGASISAPFSTLGGGPANPVFPNAVPLV